MNIRKHIIKQARSYMDTPFIHQGRTRRGLDCIGLIVRVGHDLDILHGDYTKYGRKPDGHTLQDKLREYFDRRRIDERVPGDIVLFAVPSSPCHIAILTDNGTIIHALSARGRVCEHRLNRSWCRMIRGVYSYRGIPSWDN